MLTRRHIGLIPGFRALPATIISKVALVVIVCAVVATTSSPTLAQGGQCNGNVVSPQTADLGAAGSVTNPSLYAKIEGFDDVEEANSDIGPICRDNVEPDGEAGNVAVQLDFTDFNGEWKPVSGFWESDTEICKVIVKNGEGDNEQVYDPPVQSGSWEVLDGNPVKAISHIEFFTCEDQQAPQGKLVFKKTIENQTGENVDFSDSSTFVLNYTGSEEGTVEATFSPGTFNANSSATETETALIALGAYSVDEAEDDLPTAPTGYSWDRGTPRCEVTGGADTGTPPTVDGDDFTLNDGDDEVTCFVTNTLVKDGPRDRGRLVFEKTVQNETGEDVGFPESSTFVLSYTGPEEGTVEATFSPGTFDANSSATETGTASIPFGSYSVDEAEDNLPIAPAGFSWERGTPSCEVTGGANTGTPPTADGDGFTLHEDDDVVTCSVTNKLVKIEDDKKATIKAVKLVDPEDNETKFDFNVAGSAFELGHEDESDLVEVTADGQTSYSISETPDPAFATSINCGDYGSADNATSIDVTPNGTGTKQAPEEIVCTFTNRLKRGTITVKKVIEGGGTAQAFNFTIDPALPQTTASSFQVEPGAPAEFDNVKAGKYTIAETVPDDWGFVSAVCNGQERGNPASVEIEDEGNIECIFTNKKKTGKLTIAKKTIGGNDEFDFLVNDETYSEFQKLSNGEDGQRELPVGQYTIREVNLPEGWTLKTADCGQLNDSNEVTVDLTSEGVACTFTNFKEDDEDMEEEVEKFNEVVLDHLLSHEPDRARLVRRLQQEQPVSLKDTGSLPPLKMTGSTTSGGSPITGSPAASGNSTTAGGMTGGFSMSLSGLRASMMAEDAKKIREGQEGDGMKSSFSSDPYLAPYMMTRPGWDLWIEGQVTRYSDNEGGRDRDGLFSILYVGADYAVAPGMIVGALVQVDHTDHDIDSDDVWGNIEGTGWMAGPYMGAKISENLIFDARAAWGQSSNDVELDSDDSEFRTGEFDMERWLVSAKLTGIYHHGGWRISPHVGVIWGNQDQDAFKNSLDQHVSSSSVSLGRVTFGPEFGYTETLSDGSTIEPHIAIEGIWQFDGHEMQFDGETVKTDDFRAKVEGGVIYATPEGYKLRAAGSYDGLGDDEFEAWSAKAWLNVPLN